MDSPTPSPLLSFFNREDLQNIGKIASVAMMLPLGIHYFCFIVDGELKCALNLPRVNNSGGDQYNMLYLQVTLWFSFGLMLLIYVLLLKCH